VSRLNRIPKFNNVKEEAEFWDSHDVTDYLEELVPSKLVYKTRGDKNEILTVRVAPALKRELTKVADCYDISPSSLVRMWVVEKLRTVF